MEQNNSAGIAQRERGRGRDFQWPPTGQAKGWWGRLHDRFLAWLRRNAE